MRLRLLILLRSSEEIHECLMFTKECSLMTLDTRGLEAHYLFHVNPEVPDFWKLESLESGLLALHQQYWCAGRKDTKAAWPHRRLRDVVLRKDCVRKPRSGRTLLMPLPLCAPTDKTCLNKLDFVDKVVQGDSGVSLDSDKYWMVLFPNQKCTAFVNGHLASCIVRQAALSPRFCRRLFRNLHRLKAFHAAPDLSPACHPLPYAHYLQVTWFVDLVSVWPQHRMDVVWAWHLNHMVRQRMLLDEAMAWLSTLGGAHSSLGDTFTHHAEMAGRISMKQLKLAMTMGDPLMMGRCYMFWAFSLMQRQGYTIKAKRIIRSVHRMAVNHCVKDVRLINMCLSGWQRLQHHHELHIQHRAVHTNSCAQVCSSQVCDCASRETGVRKSQGLLSCNTEAPEEMVETQEKYLATTSGHCLWQTIL